MRAVLAASICCFAATSTALSASVTVPDNSTSLAGVAGATTALLLDARKTAAPACSFWK
jgi:hypothetical protein